MTTHFTKKELTYSRTAVENGLLNEPTEKELTALKVLAVQLLEPLRRRLNAPIAITSGYRNAEVNRLVGGAVRSQHTAGEAADCYCAAGSRKLLGIRLASGRAFDQAIVYKKKQILHLSYRANGTNRRQVLYK